MSCALRRRIRSSKSSLAAEARFEPNSTEPSPPSSDGRRRDLSAIVQVQIRSHKDLKNVQISNEMSSKPGWCRSHLRIVSDEEEICDLPTAWIEGRQYEGKQATGGARGDNKRVELPSLSYRSYLIDFLSYRVLILSIPYPYDFLLSRERGFHVLQGNFFLKASGKFYLLDSIVHRAKFLGCRSEARRVSTEAFILRFHRFRTSEGFIQDNVWDISHNSTIPPPCHCGMSLMIALAAWRF